MTEKPKADDRLKDKVVKGGDPERGESHPPSPDPRLKDHTVRTPPDPSRESDRR